MSSSPRSTPPGTPAGYSTGTPAGPLGGSSARRAARSPAPMSPLRERLRLAAIVALLSAPILGGPVLLAACDEALLARPAPTPAPAARAVVPPRPSAPVKPRVTPRGARPEGPLSDAHHLHPAGSPPSLPGAAPGVRTVPRHTLDAADARKPKNVYRRIRRPGTPPAPPARPEAIH